MFFIHHLAPKLTCLVVLLSMAVFVSASQDNPATMSLTLQKGDRIIFFGDSLTALAGKEEPKKYVTKVYVRIVRETLQETHKDKAIEVDWVATGGHTGS